MSTSSPEDWQKGLYLCMLLPVPAHGKTSVTPKPASPGCPGYTERQILGLQSSIPRTHAHILSPGRREPQVNLDCLFCLAYSQRGTVLDWLLTTGTSGKSNRFVPLPPLLSSPRHNRLIESPHERAFHKSFACLPQEDMTTVHCLVTCGIRDSSGTRSLFLPARLLYGCRVCGVTGAW